MACITDIMIKNMECSTDQELALPAIIFEGEDAKFFDEYNKRPRTEHEKALLVEADRIYASMCNVDGND